MKVNKKNISANVLIIVILVLFAYSVFKNGIGLSSYVDSNNVFHPGKTLWDWLELLIIPALLGAVAWNFSDTQKNKELEISTKQFRENVMKDFITEISQYIKNRSIYEIKDIHFIETIRINTINTLRILDGEQKGQLIHFLYDSKLIGWKGDYESNYEEILPIIQLKDADLSNIKLSGTYSLEIIEVCDKTNPYFNVNLSGIDLSFTNLRNADLHGTQIFSGNFRATNLENADFDKCKLENCIFENAKFVNTSFSYLQCNTCNFDKSRLIKTRMIENEFSLTSFCMASFEKCNLQGSVFNSCVFYSYYGIPCGPDGIFSNKAVISKTKLQNTSFLFSTILPSQLKGSVVRPKIVLPNNLKNNKYAFIRITQEFNHINPAHSGMLVPDCSFKCRCGMLIDIDLDKDQGEFYIGPDNLWEAILEHIKEYHPKEFKKSYLGDIESPEFIDPRNIHIPPITS